MTLLNPTVKRKDTGDPTGREPNGDLTVIVSEKSASRPILADAKKGFVPPTKPWPNPVGVVLAKAWTKIRNTPNWASAVPLAWPSPTKAWSRPGPNFWIKEESPLAVSAISVAAFLVVIDVMGFSADPPNIASFLFLLAAVKPMSH
jgi:hypothetical protein